MNRNHSILPFAAVCLGVGILLTCFMPARALVVIAALVIIAVGVVCLRQ